MLEDFGLVLERFFPQQNKICVLSQNYGKFLAYANPKILDFLWPASSFYFSTKQSNLKYFNIDQAWRHKIPIFSCHKKMAWLTKLAKLCSKLFPTNFVCSQTFDISRNIFEFDWNSLDQEFTVLTQKACLASILKTTGLVCDPAIDDLCAVFEIIVISKVDPAVIPGLKSLAIEFKNYNFDTAAALKQIEIGLDKDFYPYFFELTNQKIN